MFDFPIVLCRNLSQQGSLNHGLLSGVGACRRMIPNGSPVSQVQPLPPPPLVFASPSFRVSIKRVYEKTFESWFGCLHPHVIFTSYENEILGSVSFAKQRNTFCKATGSGWNLHLIFEKIQLYYFRNFSCACKCI